MASVTFKGGDKGINGDISGIFFSLFSFKTCSDSEPSLKPSCRDSKTFVLIE